MGGIFGVISKEDCVMDVFFGTDYHSHLGTKRGGMCILGENGFKAGIHNISNAPFRGKFEEELDEMSGFAGIGAISDSDPQPLTVYSDQGHFALTTVGRINNKEEIVKEIIASKDGSYFMTMSHHNINNTELVAALISQGSSIEKGIENAQNKIDGSVTMLVLTKDGLYAARDKYGRTPLIIGEKEDGSKCAATESFAFINIGYKYTRELGPGEIALLNVGREEILKEAGDKMRVCAFLWTYFGYTTSIYEGKNVEFVRNRNGELMAARDEAEGGVDVDYVAGVPDSGIAHALGYANGSKIRYSRPLIKYTPTWPRSFMPQNQDARALIAKMKLVPVFKMINKKKFILVDDSIVRGTQLSETVSYLTENGAEEIHVRSACPPIMFGCKFHNFSRSVSDFSLITRRTIMRLENLGLEEVTEEILSEYADSFSEKHSIMVEEIRKELGFDSLKFQRLEDVKEAVGIDGCKLCTYCWDGKE